MAKTGRELVDFWNKLADDHPPYDDARGGYEDSVLDLARGLGADFRGASVLDVGSGWGTYAVKMAAEAATVVALDASDRMLEISRAACRSRGLANVEHVQSEWMDYELPGRFGVVFCSLCPAAREDRAKEKLLEAAAGTLVFVGFADHVRPEPLASLMALHGVDRPIFRGALDMADWLAARGLPHRRAPLRGEWTIRLGPGQARRWCARALAGQGIAAPDPDAIDRALAPFLDEPSGGHVLAAPYSVETIVWRR